MSPVHPSAARGFAGAAAEYERGRPAYPPPALTLLRDRLALSPGRAVLDLAAGTGALTRALLATGASVTAVEPVAQMAAALPAEARILDGTAEAIPLAGAMVDVVTVAQAFHWFDGDAALAEIHRVLRPGGALALVWNRRREDDPVNRALDLLLEPHRPGTPTHRAGAWRAAFSRSRLFGPLSEHEFENEQTLDAGGMADRVASISFVATLPEEERMRVVDGARALAADGPVRIPYRTEVQICRRRD